MRIAVAMSGGVDSSVAALILKEEGHEVVGVNMTVWDAKHGGSTTKKHACYGPDDHKDMKVAKEVCDIIGIPFHSFNCAPDYNRLVLRYFKDEYFAGRTPNPCVRCNQLIKFDVFTNVVKKAGVFFEKFATGHYARLAYDKSKKRVLLKKARDKYKDQSYFLYRLSQNQLSTVDFPLGEYSKKEVREIARKKGLPVHDKFESQDFYSGRYSELFCITDKQGNIVDKTGNVLGKHKGIWNYTLGQRRGLGIAAPRPLYVIELNKDKNEVVVGYEEDTYRSTLIARDLNWIALNTLREKMNVKAKIRSTHNGSDASVKPIREDTVIVEFKVPQQAVSIGQSAVFYDDDTVIGGGIIHG